MGIRTNWSINCIVGVSSLSVVILPCSVGVSIDLIIQYTIAHGKTKLIAMSIRTASILAMIM